MISYRRPNNLKDNPVKPKLRRQIDSNRGMRRCGKARCRICKFVEEGSKFEGNIFGINYAFDCDSKSVVYTIKCGKCEKL